MAGRSGSPGDQYVQRSPDAQQPGGYPPQVPIGYNGSGRPPAGPPGQYDTLLGPRPPQPPQVPLPPQVPPQAPPPGRRPRSGQRLIDYPRAHRTGFLRWLPSWKLVTGTGLAIVVLTIVGLLAAYAATPVPPVRETTSAQTTTVYYDDNKTVLTKFSEQNRTIVPLEKMSANIQMAVISAEDRTFYANKGVSPIGIVRAAWSNARGDGVLQGGSTITQQYVKNTRIENTRSWQRKVKEFFISIKINNEKDKSEILADYLNTIFFGRNTYGIEAASQAYFGVPAAKLDLAQSAYLAGIINGPELYDVHDGEESTARAKLRVDYVLDGLVELGQITPEQRAAVNFQTQVVAKVKKQAAPKRTLDDQTIYLEQMVRADLARNGYDIAEIRRGGYKIKTTFNKKLIDQAVKSVHENGMGPRTKWPKGTEVGLVSLDPRTGAVRAIYGGNGARFQNAATQDLPQAGSIYKPFTLIAALEGKEKNGTDGISLRSRFSGRSPFRYDASLVGTGSNKVTNFANEQFGKIDLITATEHSVNTVYAQLNQELGGGKRTREVAIRAGLPKEAIGPEVSNTLGNGTPRVVDMASAYGTIAAGGLHNPYYVVEQITSPEGGVIFSRDTTKPTKAFNSGVIADATYAMQQVVKSGTGAYAQALRRPVAGKTGTVGTSSRETTAAWFVGFTPQLSTAVVIHRAKADGGRDVVKGWGPFAGEDMQGGMFPVRVWTEFMSRALEGQEKLDFPEPAFVGVDQDPAPPEPIVTPSPSVSPSTDGQNGDGQNGEGQNGDGQNGNGDGQNGDGNGQNGDGQNGNGQNDQNGGQDNQNNGNPGQGDSGNNGGQNNGGQNNDGQNSGEG